MSNKTSKSHKTSINPSAETFGMLASFFFCGVTIFISLNTDDLWRFIIPIFSVALLCIGIHSFINLLYHYDKVKKQSIFATIAVVVLLFGFLCTCAGAFYQNATFLSRSNTTDATIISVGGERKHLYDDNGNMTTEDHCTTEIEYTVDNKIYKNTLPSESCDYKIGNTTRIEYNPENPAEIKSGSLIICIISAFFALVIIFVFIGYIVSTIKNKRNKKSAPKKH